MRALRPFLVPSLLFLIPMAGAAALGDPVARYPALLALLAVATVGWLGAVRAARGIGGGRSALVFVLVVAAAARVLWLLPETPLSDDLYRYLWDGRVGNSGVNPFAHPPTAAELEHLRDDEIWPRINHADIPTIYPPVAQLSFRLLDRVAPTAFGARALAALADLIVAVLLAALARARGRSLALAVVAGWCPLSVLETAGGGHVDALGAVLLAAGLLALTSSATVRSAAGGALLGLSALVKPTALLLAPGLLRAGPGAHRAVLFAGAAAAALLAVPYLDVGAELFTGFLAYAERWRFNDSFYSVLVGAGLSPDGARTVLACAILALAVAVPARIRDPLASAGCVIGLALVLSPTVHPWYALWLVPLLPFLPPRVSAAGFALVALLPVSYASAWMQASTGVWAEPAWSRPVLWIPVLALLVYGLTRRRI